MDAKYVFNETGSGSLTHRRCPFFRIKYECICLCVCVCVRLVRVSSFTFCNNLLHEVVIEYKKKIFSEISVIWKIWVTKVVLPWLASQTL